MLGATLLLRQIHPSFVQDGFPTSQAFRPTPKDESELSIYDGDLITVELSFNHYTMTWKLASVRVLALSVDECSAKSRPACPDPLENCPEYAVVDFTGHTDKECYKKSKKLQAKALARSWRHQASRAN